MLRLPAPSDDAQCDAAARFAASLLDDGLAAADLSVIAPRRILDGLPAAFARLGVPLSAPTSRPLSTVPLVRDVRAALSAAGELDRTALLALLGSPYLGPAEPLPGLRFLLDRSGILDGRGHPAERLRARAAALTGAGSSGAERPALLRAARAVDSLHAALAPLRSPATPAGWTARVRAFLDRSGVRRRAGRGDQAIARRDLAAVSRLEEALDDLASALAMAGRAADRIPRDEWAPLLDLGLERSGLPSGQGPAEGAVEAWPPEEAPGLTSRVTLVLGAERGTWPGVHRVDPLLGNAAREALQAHLGRRALPTAFHQQSEAEFRGLCALASASDVLAVGWTQGPDLEGPAPLAAQVLDEAAAPELSLSVDPTVEDARGEAEALRAAARLAGRGGAERARAALASLPDLAARASDAAERGRQERERRESWLTGAASPFAGQIPPASPPGRKRCRRSGAPRSSRPRPPAPSSTCSGGRGFASLARAIRHGATGRGCAAPRRPREVRPCPRRAGRLAAAGRRRRQGGGPAGGRGTLRAVRGGGARRRPRHLGGAAGCGAAQARPLRRGRVPGRPGAAPRPPRVRVRREVGAASHRHPGRGRRHPPARAHRPGGRRRRSRRRRGLQELPVVPGDPEEALRRGPREQELPGSGLPPRRGPGASRPDRLLGHLRAAPLRERVPPWTTSPGDPFLALDGERRAEVRAEGGRTLADGVVAAVARIRAGALPVVSEDCTGCRFGAVCRFPRAGEA